MGKNKSKKNQGFEIIDYAAEHPNVPAMAVTDDPKVRRMRIEMLTKGKERSDGSVFEPELIQYTAEPENSVALKEYCNERNREVRRHKFVGVATVRFKGVEPFKNAQEMFTYLVKNCGYRWVR